MTRKMIFAPIAFAVLAAVLFVGGDRRAWSQDDPPEPPKAKKTKKKDDDTSVISGRLTNRDPIDKARTSTYAQVHKVKLKSGTEYVFDLIRTNLSDSFDPYLRLEDPSGKMLFEDDDGAGNLNSRIVYAPPADGEYRLVVMSLGGHQEGSFDLVVMGRKPGSPPPAPGMPLFNHQPPTEFGDIVITPLAQPQFINGGNERLSHGYIEYRFEIENKGKESHRVKLQIPPPNRGGGYYGGAHLRTLSKTVEVPPESMLVVSLFQPDVPLGFGNVGVSIDGKAQDREVSINVRRNQNSPGRHAYFGGPSSDDSRISILASPDLANSIRTNIYKSTVGEPITSGMGGSTTSGTFFEKDSPHNGKSFHYRMIHGIYQADTDTLSTKSWLGLSPYDGIALGNRSLEALSPETRAALWQYVECGGTLLVAGKTKFPESWQFADTKLKGCRAATPGFGKCIVVENPNVGAWSPDDWKMIAHMWSNSRAAWDQITSVTDANANFPIVENLGIPVRSLFAFMFLFVVVIGPLNIFWLSRTNRRLWLLWTVPVISLLTTGLLFTYMGYSEGWHAHVRALTVTSLDENSQLASTVGNLGYYSPTTARGLHFSADTELSPHLNVDHHRYRGVSNGPALGMDWTDDQHLESGWIAPKVPLHMLVRCGEKRLERLPVRRDGNDLVVVNGLKANIKDLRFADKAGVIYTAKDIGAGAEAKLTRSGDKLADATPLHDKFGTTSSWRSLADQLKVSNECLRPGSYIAVLDDAPFIEQGLKDTQSRRMESVVFGISKDSP